MAQKVCVRDDMLRKARLHLHKCKKLHDARELERMDPSLKVRDE